MPKLTINGQEIEAPQGENLLEAARRIGEEIPHFCYHPHLSVAANCRMCLVEVEKQPKLQPACQMTVSEGMVVKTNSQKVLDARQAVMEFLLVNHPLDCPICDKAGECMLQDNYMRHDGQNSRQRDQKMQKPRLELLGPSINYNAERCILCTRCVRFMDEVAGEKQLAVFGRGDRNEIGVFPGAPLDHPYSMNVVDVCPVGALGNLDFRFNSRVWTLNKTASVCAGCSTGCNIEIHHKQGQIYRLIPRRHDAVNQSWMCNEGRLSYHRAHEQRILEPRILGQKTTVADALTRGRELMALALKQKGQGFVVFLSAQLTNEEAFVWLRFGRAFLKEARFVLSGRPYGEEDKLLRKADKNPNTRGVSHIAQALSVPLLDFKQAVEKIAQSPMRVIVVGGGFADDSLLKQWSHIKDSLVIAAHEHPILARASLVLPRVVHFEQEGSFVNAQGLVQRIRAAYLPPGAALPSTIWLSRLIDEQVEQFEVPEDRSQLWQEMVSHVPGFVGTFSDLGPLGRPLQLVSPMSSVAATQVL